MLKKSDADDLERSSPKLLLERWTELSSVLSRKEMPSWDEFVSIYGKVMVKNTLSFLTPKQFPFSRSW